MSGESESSEVILIAPKTNNQDGTHTYYILEPCPHEESTAESKIELIDLTAEVTDTGTIAVLSTNSSTGAWEINLTNEADPMDKGNVIHLESQGSALSMEEMITDDDCMEQYIVKDEEEDVDVEEMSQADVYSEEMKTESDSVHLQDIPSEVDSIDTSQQDQDEESEEGTLYIDDVRCLGLPENTQHTQVNNESKPRNVVDNKKETDEMIINNVKHMIEQADFIITETENSIREDNNCRENQITIEQNCEGDHHNSQKAVIQNDVIDVPSRSQKVTDIEYVDSTNTALTLLELAGGSYRNTVDGVEMEVVSIENQVITEDPLGVSPEEQLTMLTTLQPVPMEPPESPTLTPESPATTLNSAATTLDSAVTTTDSASTTLDNPKVVSGQNAHKEGSTAPPPVVRLRTNMKSEDALTQIERLKEGDVPFMRTNNRSYRGLSSPIVSQKEIAEKLIERTKSKVPYSEPKDIFFTMKIAHRLANRIVPPEKGDSENSCSDKDIIDQVTSGVEKNDHSLLTPVSRKGTFSYSEDRSVIPSQERNAISDKYELLKILEDDPDDPDEIPDLTESKLLTKIINKTKLTKRSKAKFSPLIKLHPELEKELALKQLEDFSSGKQGKKSLDIYKDKETIQKQREHNNNTNRKRHSSDTFIKSKKVKVDVEGSGEDSSLAVTVDPSLVTEKLAVEGQDEVSDQSKDNKSIKQYSNKRLSRNSETPPREIPMEILLNGVEDDIDLPDNGKVKNKIFKATNPRKRREELKKKKQTHFANVLQRNKPQKKRGRPRKKKVLPVNDSFNDDLIIHPKKKEKLKNGEDKQESEHSVSKENESPKDEKLQKSKKMTEIEKLLGDEGAINMLYSVEQKRAVGNEPKRGILPSYRRKKKDLMLKTKLVKSAVLRLSSGPSPNDGKISLRERSGKEENEEGQGETALRKISVDSHDSHHSANSGIAEVFPFPAKIVPAEASRIIRRHSSSSNYSSRSNSPRRQSVDGIEQPSVLSPAELGQGDVASISSTHKHKHTKSTHQVEVTHVKKSSKDLNRANLSRSINSTPTTSAPVTVEKRQLREQSKPLSGKPRGRPKKIPVTEDEMRKSTALETTLSAAINDFTKEITNVESNASTPKKTDTPVASKIGSISKTVNKVYKRAAEGPGRGRSKGSVVYKELSLKRHGPLVEIILAPVSTRLKNALNANVLRELTSVLTGLTKDENCRAVLLTSTGSVFCQGIDFFSLIQDSPEKRTSVALQTAVAVKDFIKALALFSKPVVAGVQGPTVGLGVTLLPLCDLVYCSDSATFQTPYARLGQVPEGAATLTLPSVLGNSVTSELLLSCRKLTSAEAFSLGLVSRVLDSENFHDQLLPVVTAMANQSSQAMDATKALLRHNLLSGLETTLISETHLLIQHWPSDECQRNFALYLQDDEQTLALQKQPT